ncbi:M28 family metallopeptidase [Verrucomicrobiota bacterium]
MMRELFILVAVCLMTGCEFASATFSGHRALSEVEALVEISPRDSGTPGAKRAAYHIASRLQSFGYDARVDLFLSNTPAGETPFFNVTAELKGLSDEWIVLGSHFDTKRGIGPDFQGANDSGSSTGLLIELARALRYKKPECSILFAFFDGEECMVKYSERDGLHGSRHLAKRLAAEERKVAGVIIVDMVGDKDLSLTIPSNVHYPLLGHLFDAAQEMGCRDKLMMIGNMIDDHRPFMEAGFPAINLIDFQYGSVPGLNDYWHTREDSLDKLSEDSLQLVGDLVLNVIGRIKPEPDFPF